jgi:hypothetical protein
MKQTLKKKGEKGENFFVIESGTCEIYVSKGVESDEILVKTCTSGDYFGELALMFFFLFLKLLLGTELQELLLLNVSPTLLSGQLID